MKKTFKVLSFIFAVVLLVTLGCVATFAADEATVEKWIDSADTTWYNDTDATFTITTAEQLAGFASLVNGGNTFAGKTIVLGNDIDLAGKQWDPIGGASVYFAGEFDGGDCTIANLTDTQDNNRKGLFGLVEDCYIHNLILKDVHFAGNMTGARVGAVAGNLNNPNWNGTGCILMDITIDGLFYDITDTNGLIGGLVGYSWNSYIKNCTIKTAVMNITSTADSAVGGMIGYGRGVTDNCYIEDFPTYGSHILPEDTEEVVEAGTYAVINYVDNKIEGLKANLSGTVSFGGFFGCDTYNHWRNFFDGDSVTGLEVVCAEGDGVYNVGGFMSYQYGGYSSAALKNCSVSGTITSKGSNPNSSFGGFVGGKGGRPGGATTCTANVAIDVAAGNAAGFVGGTQQYSAHAYAFEDCHATGSVSTDNGIAGGFVASVGHGGDGSALNVTISNSSASGAVEGTTVGGLIGSVSDVKNSNPTGGSVIMGDNTITATDSTGAALPDVGSVTADDLVIIPAAQIDDNYYLTLADAIAAAQDGDIIVLANGTHKWTAGWKIQNKTVTFKGSKDAVIDMTNVATGQNTSGATLNFEGLTVQFGTANFKGFQHAAKVVYNNVTHIGQECLYASTVEFNNVIFKVSGNAYAVWTYGASDVTFNNCEFNTEGKAVLVYIEKAHQAEIELTDCEFKSTKNVGKAAVEIGASANGKVSSYDLAFTACTADEGFAANNTESNLWGNKDYIGSDSGSSVAINGEAQKLYIVEISREVDGETVTTFYTSIQEAIDAAAAGEVIKLLNNIAEAGINVAADKDVIIDLNGKTVTGNIVNKGTLTVKNGTIINNAFKSCIESVGEAAKLIVEDLTATSTRHALRIEGGEATIKSGTFTAIGRKGETETVHALNAGGDYATTVVIEGGTFNGIQYNGNAEQGDSGAAVMAQANAVVTIKGGTFAYGQNYTVAGNGSVIITGDAKFDEANAFGAAVKVGDWYYTFDYAWTNFVKQGGEHTIKLEADADFADASWSTEMKKLALTIDLNGHALTLKKTMPIAGSFYGGNTLIITDSSAAADGQMIFENDSCIEFFNDYADTLIIEAGIFVKDNGEGAIIQDNAWGTVNQTITLNGGDFSGVTTEILDIDKGDKVTKAADVAVKTPAGYAWENDTTLVTAKVQCGDEYYLTIAEAVAAAGDNAATITLLADIDLTDGVVIAKGQNITLDLNGKTITYNSAKTTSDAAITNYGTLAIIGDGTITYTSTAPSSNAAYATNAITNCGTLTVDGATIENNTVGGASYAIDNNSSAGAASVTVESGVISSNGVAIRQFANSAAANDLTINGGEITGSRALWIQLPGTDSEKKPVVNVDINDGTVTATGENGGYQLAIYAYSYGNDWTNVDIDISGGTFDGDIALGGGQKNGVASLDITGGNFTDVYTYGTSEDIDISGGTFVYAPADKYIAPNAGLMIASNGTYSVVEDDKAVGVGAVASLNGNYYYETLEEAVLAAQDGDTVYLLTDYEGEGFKYNADITIDLGGFVFKNTSPIRVWSEGFNGTIKNGTIAPVPGANGNNQAIQYYASGKLTLDGVDIIGDYITGNTYLLTIQGAGDVILTGDTAIYAHRSLTAQDGRNAIHINMDDNSKINVILKDVYAISGGITFWPSVNGSMTVDIQQVDVWNANFVHYATLDTETITYKVNGQYAAWTVGSIVLQPGETLIYTDKNGKEWTVAAPTEDENNHNVLIADYYAEYDRYAFGVITYTTLDATKVYGSSTWYKTGTNELLEGMGSYNVKYFKDTVWLNVGSNHPDHYTVTPKLRPGHMYEDVTDGTQRNYLNFNIYHMGFDSVYDYSELDAEKYADNFIIDDSGAGYITITPATITADKVEYGGNWDYDGEAHFGTVPEKKHFHLVNENKNLPITLLFTTDKAAYDAKNVAGFTSEDPFSIMDYGTKPIYYVVTAKNHAPLFGSYEISINQISIKDAVFELTADSFVYNAEAHTVTIKDGTVTLTVDGVTFNLKLDEDYTIVLDTANNIGDTFTNAGSYTFIIKAVEGSNYKDSASREWKITKAPFAIIFESQNIIYGAAEPTFEPIFLGLYVESPEEIKAALEGLSINAFSAYDESDDDYDNVGQYTISALIRGSAKNYVYVSYDEFIKTLDEETAAQYGKYEDAYLTVEKKEVYVSASYTGDLYYSIVSKLIKNEYFSLSFNKNGYKPLDKDLAKGMFTADHIVGSWGFYDNWGSQAYLLDTRNAGYNLRAAVYTWKSDADLQASNNNYANYILTRDYGNAGFVEIQKLPLAVTVEKQTLIYGDVWTQGGNIAVTDTILNEVRDNSLFTINADMFTTDYKQGNNVGKYNIIFNVADFNDKNTNYVIKADEVTGELEIIKRILAFVPQADSVIYGYEYVRNSEKWDCYVVNGNGGDDSWVTIVENDLPALYDLFITETDYVVGDHVGDKKFIWIIYKDGKSAEDHLNYDIWRNVAMDGVDVSKAPLKILPNTKPETWNAQYDSPRYNGEKQVGDLQSLVLNGETINLDEVKVMESGNVGIDAGDYGVKIQVVGGDYDGAIINAVFTIRPFVVKTVKWENTTQVYTGEELKPIAYTLLPNGERVYFETTGATYVGNNSIYVLSVHEYADDCEEHTVENGLKCAEYKSTNYVFDMLNIGLGVLKITEAEPVKVYSGAVVIGQNNKGYSLLFTIEPTVIDQYGLGFTGIATAEQAAKILTLTYLTDAEGNPTTRTDFTLFYDAEDELYKLSFYGVAPQNFDKEVRIDFNFGLDPLPTIVTVEEYAYKLISLYIGAATTDTWNAYSYMVDVLVSLIEYGAAAQKDVYGLADEDLISAGLKAALDVDKNNPKADAFMTKSASENVDTIEEGAASTAPVEYDVKFIIDNVDDITNSNAHLSVGMGNSITVKVQLYLGDGYTVTADTDVRIYAGANKLITFHNPEYESGPYYTVENNVITIEYDLDLSNMKDTIRFLVIDYSGNYNAEGSDSATPVGDLQFVPYDYVETLDAGASANTLAALQVFADAVAAYKSFMSLE